MGLKLEYPWRYLLWIFPNTPKLSSKFIKFELSLQYGIFVLIIYESAKLVSLL